VESKRRVLFTLLIATAIPRATAATTAQAPGIREGYVIVGEALSSAYLDEPIEFASRMFSLGNMGAFCRESRAGDISRLRYEGPPLQLRVGEPFRPGSLGIVALDASGAVLQRVPVAIEVRGPADAFARDNLQRVDDPSMTPTMAARVRFRVRTICNEGSAEAFIPADIDRE
jgi:hypothetical protein